MNEFLETEVRQRGPGASKRRLVSAHHRDDQAETVLMRLARGSGLDGLSGMRRTEELDMTAIGSSGSLIVVRPLLEIPKARLIATLKARGLQWSEDPSNVSDRFERVRVRRALEVLETLGVNAGSIARSARRLARARRAIAADCAKAARRMIRRTDGLVAEIDTAKFADKLAADLAVLAECSPSEAPKRVAVTLGGCRVEGTTGSSILIWRERGREPLPEFQLEPGARRLWDRRFLVSLAPRAQGPATVRALAGEWRQLPSDALQFAGRPVPRAALETTPSFWQADRLVAVPCVPGQEGDLQLYRAEFAGLRSLSSQN
jgi:tRNA(Ile)-lysidine synthase